jgi:hypothetical protein
MGTCAESNFEICCCGTKAARKVKSVIGEMIKESDKLGNFRYIRLEPVKKGDNSVFGHNFSGRIQNLEYQNRLVWKKVKDIPGVESAEFPIMIEGEGQYFSNLPE